MRNEEIYRRKQELDEKFRKVYSKILPELDELSLQRIELQNDCPHINTDYNEDDFEECLDCNKVLYI